MTTIAAGRHRPVTLRGVLSGAGPQLADPDRSGGQPDALHALDEYLARDQRTVTKLRRMVPTVQRSMLAVMRERMGAALDRDVLTVLIEGWKVSENLLAAAHRTAGTPVQEIVPLRTEEIRHQIRPGVTVELSGQEVWTVGVQIDVCARIADLSATIGNGALLGVEVGGCEVDVVLADDAGWPIASRSAQISDPAQFALPRPIILVPTAARTGTVPPGSTGPR